MQDTRKDHQEREVLEIYQTRDEMGCIEGGGKHLMEVALNVSREYSLYNYTCTCKYIYMCVCVCVSVWGC